MSSFSQELRELINKYSKENGSNTPDFILASYLASQLFILDMTINARSQWLGESAADKSEPEPEQPKTKEKKPKLKREHRESWDDYSPPPIPFGERKPNKEKEIEGGEESKEESNDDEEDSDDASIEA